MNPRRHGPVSHSDLYNPTQRSTGGTSRAGKAGHSEYSSGSSDASNTIHRRHCSKKVTYPVHATHTLQWERLLVMCVHIGSAVTGHALLQLAIKDETTWWHGVKARCQYMSIDARSGNKRRFAVQNPLKQGTWEVNEAEQAYMSDGFIWSTCWRNAMPCDGHSSLLPPPPR